MILIIGATGTVGTNILARLNGLGIKHRALEHVRKVGRSNLREIVTGDLGDPKSLDRALKGIDTVFLLLPLSEKQTELEGNVVKAAIKSGVKHLVKLSVHGAKLGGITIAREHRRVEELIETSGIPYTFLRPTFFMQNILSQSGSIMDQGVFSYPVPNGRIALVDARDVADVAVKALTEKGHEGKAYEITGPEALSFGEAAERMSAVIGRSIRFIPGTIDQARSSLLSAGIPKWNVDALAELMTVLDKGVGLVSYVTEKVTGYPARSVEDFAGEYKISFLKAA